MKKQKKSKGHSSTNSKQRKPNPTAESKSKPESKPVEAQISEEGVQLQDKESAEAMPARMRQEYIQRVSHIVGNRRASQLVEQIQRHPGHGKPEESDFSLAMLAPEEKAPSAAVMRAEMLAETTQIATVNAGSAPLDLNSHPPGPLFDDARVLHGQLAAGDQVRILERTAGGLHIHVERGALAGRTGYVPNDSVTVSAAGTSQRTPTAGPENAYTQLQTELARVPPNRAAILFIIQTRLTMAQHQQLLQAANPEWASLMGMGAISANDILHIHAVLGSRLQRKVSDYFAKGGNTADELRLAFATADGDERLEVARNDALVGRLRRIFAAVHPEIIFGTRLATLYPDSGRVRDLRGTNPELARWLSARTRRGTDLGEAAEERASGLQGALTTMDDRGDARARPTVMSAVRDAPRGSALPENERNALESIEERAYEAGNYTTNDLGVMFLTRFGRPFRRGASRTKTFIHRIWSALERLPADHVLLTNVLGWFDVNTDPAAAGSFTDYLSSASFGQLVSDPPRPETLHTVRAQNSRNVDVLEPTLDLLQPGTQVSVQQSDGSSVNARVSGVNVRRRRLALNRRVSVNAGADITPAGASAYREGTAHSITAPSALYADSAGAPNLANTLGTIAPGNLFSEMSRTVVGGTTYIFGGIHAGPLAGQGGWIDVAGATSLGGSTMGQEMFEWTARHEMGHALDLQLNGFSRFSGPSRAAWRKYTGVADWLTDLINVASVPNPDLNQNLGGFNGTFRQAARTYANAVQTGNAANPPATNAQAWLQAWVTAGGSQNVYDVVTQFNAAPGYFNTNNLGLPALGGRIFGAHYNEYFSADAGARTESLAVGVPPYAYTCTYEFFADHYAAYTGPGTGGETYARAVPDWAKNFFDRMIGEASAGPRVGMERRRMG